jgi:hypothetical protein
MTWSTPSYEEINMSAEIGGYQEDFDERARELKKPAHRDDSESVSNEA